MKSVSILIPTYNSAQIIRGCLESIGRQKYPKEQIELIIADGGSTDQTLNLVKAFAADNPELKVVIVPNPLITGEAGKAAALKQAGGEIIALIDSDNILPSGDWLQRMLQPFENPQIVATEPVEYTHRKEDGYITRYCALMGMNDPLCYFLGNYDRYNYLSLKWTGLDIRQEDLGDYIQITLAPGEPVPTIGANGFCIRRQDMLAAITQDGKIPDYLFDIDVLPQLLACRKQPLLAAKVKIGIVHLYSPRLINFVRKQQRRIRDYLFFQQQNARIYQWRKTSKINLLRFILSCLLVFPLLLQMGIGYRRRPDTAWLFHLPACWVTLVIYGWGMSLGRIRMGLADRKNWKQ